jgi:putative acetyltransferase
MFCQPSLSMTIAFESPDQPEVIALITELDAYQDTLYPPESRHYLDLPSLNQSNVFFAVAEDGEGRAIGSGAVVLYPEFDEIKRMYVSPRGRGQGVAGKLLILLESRAIGAGCQLLMLETGPYQHEALALYVSAGYERRGPFGEYANDPLSLFMQKHISASDAVAKKLTLPDSRHPATAAAGRSRSSQPWIRVNERSHYPRHHPCCVGVG